MSVRVLAGDRRAAVPVAAWLSAPDAVASIRDDAHRRIAALDAEDGTRLVVKLFRIGSGAHPLRERLRAWVGQGPADREWRALRALHAAGAPVPRPVAFGIGPSGDRWLALEAVPGVPLREALAAPPRERRARLVALGRAVAAFHACGFRHGDLHVGNVLVAGERVVLIDLQRSGPGATASDRLADLAHLDHSLGTATSTAGRVRVRAAALGADTPLPAAARAALRAIAEGSARRRRRHFESRLRHALREGRAFARVRAAGARGLRARTLGAEAVEEALALHAETALRPPLPAASAGAGPERLDAGSRTAVCAFEVGGHRLVSKAWRAGSLGRALADAFRGSPARRAWVGGHGLALLGVGAPMPLAFLEWRRLGIPVRSIVLMEDLRPDRGAHDVLERGDAGERTAALDALLRALLRLHRAGASHGDLKASNVLLHVHDGCVEARLVDLEDVRFPGALSDAARVHALAQLCASVGDALDAPPRERFFARYARALPFAAGPADARGRVFRESLARGHRFTGAGCAGPATPGASSATPVRGAARSTGT